MSEVRRRLSEQDLAQLYVQTEAPLRLDDLLQARETGQTGQIAVHDSISGQTPDLALISLSLCGLIIARDYPLPLKDGVFGPILRELVVACEDNLLTVGRLWLDSACHGIAPDAKIDKPTVESIPDRLRILTSILMELREGVEGDESVLTMHQALGTLYYQSESHADLAEKFVAQLARAPKKEKVKKRELPNQIPLPFDLDRPQTGAEILSFSLFHKRR